jgi:hypothetical protein
MKKAIAVLGVLSLILGLSACKMIGRYNVNWIIGKDSDQIQARYGEFDWTPKDVPEDGLYRNCCCSYNLVYNQRHWTDGRRVPNEFLEIYFDENGVAYKAEKYVDETSIL